MIWHDLGSPRPRPEPLEYTPLAWLEGDAIQLEDSPSVDLGDQILQASRLDFESLILRRRTRYGFRAPPHAALGKLFELTSRVQAQVGSPLGFPLSMRPVPSAGGIHPIHVVVQLAGSDALRRYDPFEHVLRRLTTDVDVPELRRAMCQLVDGEGAALLLFVAEPGKTDAKYLDADSLVWRDAGALLGYFSLAAEALDLNFVPLGATGQPWASRIHQQQGLVGVGTAFVGARP